MTVAPVGTSLGNNNLSATTSSIVFSLPSGSAAGHTAIMSVVENTGTATYTAPSGWTLLHGPDDNNANLRTEVWVKDLVSGDIGNTVTVSSTAGARFIGLLSVYSGTSAALIAATFGQDTTATTSHVAPALTTTADFCGIYNLWTFRVATAAPSPTLTAPSSHTQDAIVVTNFTTSPNYSLVATHRTTPGVAGSYGGGTGTSSASATANLYTLSLPPVASGSGIHHYIVKGGAEVPITLKVLSGGIEK